MKTTLGGRSEDCAVAPGTLQTTPRKKHDNTKRLAFMPACYRETLRSAVNTQPPTSSPTRVPAITALTNARAALDALLADTDAVQRIETVARVMADCFAAGNKVLACGNGGSACDAMHFCEELTGRFRDDREPLPAIACVDAGHITCTANDYGYDAVFERWVRALAKPGDVVFLLSTSGNSANVIRAAHAAGKIGCTRVALLGNPDTSPKDSRGGKLANTCEHEWIVPGTTADRIQELHMLLLHTVIECAEGVLAG